MPQNNQSIGITGGVPGLQRTTEGTDAENSEHHVSEGSEVLEELGDRSEADFHEDFCSWLFSDSSTNSRSPELEDLSERRRLTWELRRVLSHSCSCEDNEDEEESINDDEESYSSNDDAYYCDDESVGLLSDGRSEYLLDFESDSDNASDCEEFKGDPIGGGCHVIQKSVVRKLCHAEYQPQWFDSVDLLLEASFRTELGPGPGKAPTFRHGYLTELQREKRRKEHQIPWKCDGNPVSSAVLTGVNRHCHCLEASGCPRGSLCRRRDLRNYCRDADIEDGEIETSEESSSSSCSSWEALSTISDILTATEEVPTESDHTSEPSAESDSESELNSGSGSDGCSTTSWETISDESD